MDKTKTHPHQHQHQHQHGTLELTVLSLEDMRVDPKLATHNLYVLVRPESINCYTTGMAAEDGGGNPCWNEKLLVEIPTHARSLTLEVKCKTSISCVKDVGVARIPLSDILGGLASDHCLQFFSYRLRDWGGRHNGVLNFSVRVKSMDTLCSCGFQLVRDSLEDNTSSSSSSSCDVVVGIPVQWNNHERSNVSNHERSNV